MMVPNVQTTRIKVEYFILLFVMLILSSAYIPVDGLSAIVPYFEPRSNNVSYHVGETATLYCAVKGLGDRFLVWRRTSEPNPLTIGDFVYSPDHRFSVSKNTTKHEWNLVIRNVSSQDAGVYECAVSSRKTYKRLVLLRVTEKKEETVSEVRGIIFRHDSTLDSLLKTSQWLQGTVVYTPGIKLSGENFINKGSRLLLFCNATGEDYAPDGVDWFFDGHHIDQYAMSRVKISNEIDIKKQTLYSTLEIKPTLMSDRGTYVCRGPNSETEILTVHVLDEEKSNIDKRGFVKDLDSESCSCFKRPTYCEVFTIYLLSILLQYRWLYS